MKLLPVSGKLAGEYSTTIAGYWDAANPDLDKLLRYVLHIDGDNGWRVTFHVTIAGESRAFDSLASAIRTFDNAVLDRQRGGKAEAAK